jgi:hypothetical protein
VSQFGVNTEWKVLDFYTIMCKGVFVVKQDFNEKAFSVVGQLTGEVPKPKADRTKNPSAVALGRLGGLKGGKARAAKLSAKKRSEIAKKAVEARWNKQK